MRFEFYTADSELLNRYIDEIMTIQKNSIISDGTIKAISSKKKCIRKKARVQVIEHRLISYFEMIRKNNV